MTYDPILEDIKESVRTGYFDRMKSDGPSELASTPVEELLKRVQMMSPEARREYLSSISCTPERVWRVKERIKRPSWPATTNKGKDT